ncbi:TetR/AcrR family transcriptional regulator [Antrihabitans sp. YC2-6]|uniref:TetR/AcrR family transcriptional regulator n=1 Tax=Antrihabitans sp. YC2-6 TaxID=2799498 RepID=UPI0018F36A01|nr:TetR family transcriptional regulator [Antrihabitans sp. YC2-6]MBJ8344208.1 TetR family transcriptional regulator [Antrihabitans sp. YC2-6]
MSTRLSVEERRAHLIEAAIGLAERKGVAAVTTRDVAQAAGVSLGVVHYCFENKDALMTEVVKTLTTELRDSVDGDPRVHEWHEKGLGALRSLLRMALGVMWHDIERTPDRQLLTYEITTYALREGDATPERLGIAREQYAFNDSTLLAVLEMATSLTGTAWRLPPSALSRLMLSMIDGLVLRWLVDEDSVTANEQLDHISDIVAAQAIE